MILWITKKIYICIVHYELFFKFMYDHLFDVFHKSLEVSIEINFHRILIESMIFAGSFRLTFCNPL